jgi:hypothetical protein
MDGGYHLLLIVAMFPLPKCGKLNYARLPLHYKVKFMWSNIFSLSPRRYRFSENIKYQWKNDCTTIKG